MQKLKSMSGPSFDGAYMQQMVKDHAETLDLLKQASAQAMDPLLRAHVEELIPHVQQHLALAQRMTGDLIGRASPGQERHTAL